MDSLAERYRSVGAWRGETIWAAFVATAARHPEKCWLVDGDRRTTFAAAAGDAERLAGGLARLGVGAQDTVAFQLPNWTETALLFLACARLGAIANPCLPTFGERDLRFVLQESGAGVLLVPGDHRGVDYRSLATAVRPDCPALRALVAVRATAPAGWTSFDDLLRGPSPATPPPADAQALALLMYTSGSTAAPKGVQHTHDSLLAEAYSLGPVHGFDAADTTLMPSPLTHVSGLVHAVLVPAVFGTTAVLMERWDPAAALASIARERVTYMVGAPTFLRDLAHHPDLPQHDVSSFRLFSCGGADVDPTLVREAAARLGCVAKRVYGSTEFPTITTTGPDDPPERRIDSEGRPIGAAEIRLVDDDGVEVGPDQEGEILARGPELFRGYRDPALDRDTFTDDGWFRTGDLGAVDAAGYLRITGRKKDVIIRKGENISAREVEDLIATHPGVAEVAVVGVKDAVAGEIACAVVRVRAGAAAPALGEVCAFLLQAGLSKRKLPERLEVVAEFPRTDSGKIVKRVLRDRLNG